MAQYPGLVMSDVSPRQQHPEINMQNWKRSRPTDM